MISVLKKGGKRPNALSCGQQLFLPLHAGSIDPVSHTSPSVYLTGGSTRVVGTQRPPTNVSPILQSLATIAQADVSSFVVAPFTLQQQIASRPAFTLLHGELGGGDPSPK
jgi:hypothetical protein